MAVLMEFYNVIIKNDTIEKKYPLWLEGYITNLPNKTFCTDGKITRVGFMSLDNSYEYIRELERFWFIGNNNTDICITKMWVWTIWECSWLWCGIIEWMWYDFTAIKWEKVTPDDIVLPEWLDKNHKSERKVWNYKFWYVGTNEGVFFIDWEQKYNLQWKEVTPAKEYLEEYIRPLIYDEESFEHIIWPYSKDKNKVYFLDKIINWANPKYFEVISLLQLISKDNNNIFFTNIKTKNVDINTYELKWWYFAIDKNYVYHLTKLTKEPIKHKLTFWSYNWDNAYYYHDEGNNLHIKTYKGDKIIVFSWDDSRFEEWIYYYPNYNSFMQNDWVIWEVNFPIYEFDIK